MINPERESSPAWHPREIVRAHASSPLAIIRTAWGQKHRVMYIIFVAPSYFIADLACSKIDLDIDVYINKDVSVDIDISTYT